jgi:hypothetical protein
MLERMWKEVVVAKFKGRSKNSIKTSVMIVDDPAGIRTEHLTNISQNRIPLEPLVRYHVC